MDETVDSMGFNNWLLVLLSPPERMAKRRTPAGGKRLTVTTKLVPDVGLERGGKSPAVEIFIDGKPTGFTAPHTFVLNPGQRYELRGKPGAIPMTSGRSVLPRVSITFSCHCG